MPTIQSAVGRVSVSGRSVAQEEPSNNMTLLYIKAKNLSAEDTLILKSGLYIQRQYANILRGSIEALGCNPAI